MSSQQAWSAPLQATCLLWPQTHWLLFLIVNHLFYPQSTVSRNNALLRPKKQGTEKLGNLDAEF